MHAPCAVVAYAKGGPLARVWRNVTEGTYGASWREFCASVAALPMGQVWRHNQAGDLPGDRHDVDAEALAALTTANRGRRGFTFTHYDVLANLANRAAVAAANVAGFVVNLSANNLTHADALAALQIAPVAVVLPAETAPRADVRTPDGRRVVVCPATYLDKVSCETCQLCARASRKTIVGFPAHGAAKRLAETEAATA